MEGRVTVRFAITSGGDIKDVKIIKKSRNRHLNEAALAAVKLSAPFPKPPARFFKEDLTLVITIVFELT